MVNLIHGESHLQPESMMDSGCFFIQKTEAVAEIGRIKQREGLGVKDVGRERKVLDRVGELAGEENAEYVQEIYREIMNQACRFQERQKGEGK